MSKLHEIKDNCKYHVYNENTDDVKYLVSRIEQLTQALEVIKRTIKKEYYIVGYSIDIIAKNALKEE